MQLYIYLDWNVFNKIENLNSLESEELETYSTIKHMIFTGIARTPFSNAHISDLARGYLKNPTFTEGHIKTITELTGNLCIVQYWGEQHVKWHHRDPREFLESTLAETDMTAKSFSELLYVDDVPLINNLFDIQKSLLRLQPIHESFKEIYRLDPVFNSVFPRTKVEMNALAFVEDLYQFSSRIKTDFALYRNFQKFMNQLRLKMPQFQLQIQKSQQKVIGKPKYLTWDQLIDSASEKMAHKSKRAAYDRIVGLYTTTDLKGYSQDERFANMLDDAVHTYYGAHCDYFITRDKRCSDKAKRVFEILRIQTKVMTPEEFASSYKNPS